MDVDELLKDFRSDFLGADGNVAASSTSSPSMPPGNDADDWLSFFTSPEFGGGGSGTKAPQDDTSTIRGDVAANAASTSGGGSDDADEWLSAFTNLGGVSEGQAGHLAAASADTGAQAGFDAGPRQQPGSQRSSGRGDAGASGSLSDTEVDDWLDDLLRDTGGQQQQGSAGGGMGGPEADLPLWAWNDSSFGELDSDVTWTTSQDQGKGSK